MSSSSDDGAAIACRLDAFTPPERERHAALLASLRERVRATREEPDGWAFQLDSEAATLLELAEWIGFERRCCRFIRFELATSESEGTWLRLRGPEGTKAIILDAFSAGRPPS